MTTFMERILRVFNFRVLQECVTLIAHLEQLGISLSQFKEHMRLYNETNAMYREVAEKQHKKQYLKHQKFIEHAPNCPSCRRKLDLRESTDQWYESEWFCTECGYVWYTDISVADQKESIEATVRKKKFDFPPEEVRANKDTRLKRRKICDQCDQLTPSKTCKACGCRMKHRTYYEILTCPKKFW